MIWTAWVRESKPVEGPVAYGVEAATHAEASEAARRCFGFHLIEVETIPQQTRAK